jgi:hypothetical protein
MLTFKQIHAVVANGRGSANVKTLDEAIGMTNHDGVPETYFLLGSPLVIFNRYNGFIVLTSQTPAQVAITWTGLWNHPCFEEFFTTVFLNGLPTMRLLELLDISFLDLNSAKNEFETLMEISLQGRMIKDLGIPR